MSIWPVLSLGFLVTQCPPGMVTVLNECQCDPTCDDCYWDV